MLGFDPIASLPLAAVPQENNVYPAVDGLSATAELGGGEVLVIWSAVVVPVNDWTPINIYYPS